jgi:2-polyprenyl-3-methyl-5-hydroxy-6-metoxy-1,4-benzoquinol methylase
VLRALGATRIVGVEPVASAAALAREHYDTVTTGAFEDWQPPGDERFDLVVFADVLEHLVDPGAALRRARDVLAPDGVVLVSVPNVRCILVPAQLILRGDWPTAVEGIFDATHLRFFTSKSMRRLLVQAGLRPLAHLNYSLHFAPLIRRGLVPRLVSEFLAMQNFFLAEIR